MQAHGPDLVEEGVPLVEAMIAAVDGERDPRCLMLAFGCIRLMAQLHLQAGGEAAQV